MNNDTRQAKQVLAKKFNLKPSEVISFKMGDKVVVTVDQGIYKGSYNTVMKAPKKDYEIRIGNKRYDTRTGMTSAVYDAKVQDARDRNVTLPDSQELSQETGDLWTWTLLTGEQLTADGVVPVRRVFDGGVNRVVSPPDSVDRAVRVCPAVVLEFLTSDVAASLEAKSLSEMYEMTNKLQDAVIAQQDTLTAVMNGLDQLLQLQESMLEQLEGATKCIS